MTFALRAGALLWCASLIVVPLAVEEPAPLSPPLWLDANGRIGPAAHEALRVLRDAGNDGLEPHRYQYARLVELAGAIGAGLRSPAADREFDARLTQSMLLYLQHLQHGQLQRVHDERPALLSPLLRDAVAGNRLEAFIQESTPSRMEYAALRSTLQRYRTLSEDPAVRNPALPQSVVRPGDRSPAIPALHGWLMALGDLSPAIPPPHDDVYEGPLVAGVQQFQRRHGLEADGVIGTATRAAMLVPIAQRIRQIELALERIRTLDDPGDRKSVVLNIPMFRVWGWDSGQRDGRPAISLRAIVGRRITPTPVLQSEIRRVIFRPYWNVPPSILRNELLPVITKDPGYVARNDMEIVRRGDTFGIVPVSRDAIDGLRAGTHQLRQRPGPSNALGLVKLQIESDEGVHLHGTPHQQLFERPSRAFSHGCIRVDDPIALATWMLNDPVTWPREQVIAATTGADAREVSLVDPVHVSLFYATAAIDPDDGTLRFSDDIYGLDTALERALAQLR